VRRVVWLLIAFGGILWMSDPLDAQPPDPVQSPIYSPWRRTKNGWERSDFWALQRKLSQPPQSETFPMPHPMVLTFFELLASSLVLLAFPPGGFRAGNSSRVDRKCLAEND
jgi:hypothetical protein